MKPVAHFPFRWVLPIAQLMLCGILLWPFRSAFVLQFAYIAHVHFPRSVKSPVSRILGPLVPVSPDNLNDQTLTDLRLAVPPLLNLPGALVGLARRESIPQGMLSEFWRAFSWPIVGVMFWWMAGRGIEALLASRSHVNSPAITWAETFVALLISALTFVLCVGDITDPSMRSESIFPWRLEFVASILWLFLASAIIVARVLQWRNRHRLKTEAAQQVSPAQV